MKKRLLGLLIAPPIFLIIFIGIVCLNLLGCFQPKIYYVLLQNNGELRPSGGFMGSYLKLKFTHCRLNNFSVQDIYVPDGQILGHVESPWPIQQAFGQGWWKLRDSNWEPDFPKAAKQIQWFLEKSGEEKADGLIAINLIPIKEALKITGPINLPDYQEQINAQNFINLIQSYAEKDFFPGSTQKKDFLSALSKQLIFKIKHFALKQWCKLIKIVLINLHHKQILLYSNNIIIFPSSRAKSRDLEKLINFFNFGGQVQRKYQDKNNLISDYLYLVDTNLSANKANFYVERAVNQEVSLDNGLLKEKLIITYKNNGQFDRPQPPQFWGGVYENYLRVLIPEEMTNIKIKINGQDYQDKIEIKNYPDKNIKSVGFFVIIPPLSQTTVEINYEKILGKTLPKKHPAFKIFPTPGVDGVNYVLEIQKQPGIESYPYTIQIPSKNITIEKNIKQDEVFKLKI